MTVAIASSMLFKDAKFSAEFFISCVVGDLMARRPEGGDF